MPIVKTVNNPHDPQTRKLKIIKRDRSKQKKEKSVESIYYEEEERKKLIGTAKEVPTFEAGEMGIDDLPPYVPYCPLNYKDGPEGFITWAEDNVSIPIYPEGSDIAVWTRIGKLPKETNKDTGRSYWDFWTAQKAVLRQCLRMVDNRFIYRLIVLCWPRGDGKSLLACLIQLWKFFNWPRQQIVLGANSRDQVTFVHFDIMKEIILNSPPLLKIVGKRNIQEKQIKLKDSKGNVSSVIRAISSFSGIVSNITGYTFSEIFDMKNSKFFVQLDGSMRNVPNAIGVIDSTVSTKTHILYSLFTSFVKKESKTVYFSYRYSRNADFRDYWSPNMSQKQLDDYKSKFPLGEFERYFKNTWGSISDKIFTDDMIENMMYIGSNDKIGNFHETSILVSEKIRYLEALKQISFQSDGRVTKNLEFGGYDKKIKKIDSELISVEKYYSLTDGFAPSFASLDDLIQMGDLFDTDWSILCGLDRADPMKGSQQGARTMFNCIAKGLPGSKSNARLYDESTPLDYIYLLLYLTNIESNDTKDIEAAISLCNTEYEGIDAMCGERWAAADLYSWTEDENIPFEVVFPNYDRQKSAFSSLLLAVSKGRFISPITYVAGSKDNDVLREEMKIFYHDADKRWFGSPEKNEKHGVQDDCLFSIAWSVYGGRALGINDFRPRKKNPFFGTMYQNRELLGGW